MVFGVAKVTNPVSWLGLMMLFSMCCSAVCHGCAVSYRMTVEPFEWRPSRVLLVLDLSSCLSLCVPVLPCR